MSSGAAAGIRHADTRRISDKGSITGFIDNTNINHMFMRKSDWNLRRRTDILKLTKRKANAKHF